MPCATTVEGSRCSTTSGGATTCSLGSSGRSDGVSLDSLSTEQQKLIRFSEHVEAFGEAGSEPWSEALSAVERQGTGKADGKLPAAFSNPWKRQLSQLIAWRNAKDLSINMGTERVTDYAWPVLWGGDHVYVASPSTHRRRDFTIIPHFMPTLLTRKEAMERFKYEWKNDRNYEHLGDYPKHLRGGFLQGAPVPPQITGSTASGGATAWKPPIAFPVKPPTAVEPPRQDACPAARQSMPSI